MKRSSITETKNNLSRLIDEVKNGTSILILDRNIPVARLEPVNDMDITKDDHARLLIRQGLASEPGRTIDIDKFLARNKVTLPEGVSATRTLTKERASTQ